MPPSYPPRALAYRKRAGKPDGRLRRAPTGTGWIAGRPARRRATENSASVRSTGEAIEAGRGFFAPAGTPAPSEHEIPAHQADAACQADRQIGHAVAVC